MADIGTKEFALRFGCSQETAANWCRKGLIPGATQDSKGSPWHIPVDAVPPTSFKRRKKH